VANIQLVNVLLILDDIYRSALYLQSHQSLDWQAA